MQADLDERDFEQADGLCDAAWNNQIEEVMSLIAKGADVNAIGSKATPPLWFAVENRQVGTIRYLLERGANVVAYPNMEGWTPLAHAVEDAVLGFTDNVDRKPYMEMVSLLLEYGADANVNARPLECSPVEYARRLFLHKSTEPIAMALSESFQSHAST